MVAYGADQWQPADYESVRANPGESAGQAKFEALTLLISVATWRPLLETTQGSLTFVGDALGILQDALELRAREPILNGIMGELALQLAPLGSDTRAAHIWSGRNSTGDALSRLQQGAQVELPLLSGANRVRRKPMPGSLQDSILSGS